MSQQPKRTTETGVVVRVREYDHHTGKKLEALIAYPSGSPTGVSNVPNFTQAGDVLTITVQEGGPIVEVVRNWTLKDACVRARNEAIEFACPKGAMADLGIN